MSNENSEKLPHIRRMGLLFVPQNDTISLRDKLHINKLVGKHFYLGKNAGLFTLATWFVVNSLSRSNKAKHFSGVRLRLHTFFILEDKPYE